MSGEALPHRLRFELLEGVDAPAAAFDAALARGRLHHAWLLTGPKGLGKAAFAFRAARRLLGAAPTAGGGPLNSAADDPVNRLIAAQSHPDLLVLDRDETGEKRRTISVDEARRLPDVFTKAPALASRRVAIIDAADDLNPNAANAVLKTLEEPPTGSVLFLVCHAPGRLLPTIRSRCRRLVFRPWTEAELRAYAARRGLDWRPGAVSPGDLQAAEASPGFDARDWVARLPDLDRRAMLALTDRFRGGEGALAFAGVTQALAQAVRERALREPQQAAAWAAVWRRLDQLPGEVEAVNLDRADALWSVLGDLRAAARQAA
jgi:DNA polymerase-3 subunit delta'